MAFWIAAGLLAVFVGNVTWGAITSAQPLSNVAEMLLLFAASIAFVVGILLREARAKTSPEDSQ